MSRKTAQDISRQMGRTTERGISREIDRITGRAKSQDRAFHGRWPNYMVAHFTGDGQITWWGHFMGDGQITGSRISQEMPNHGVAHFTGDAKSQGRRAFHRVARNHRVVAHFTGSREITGSSRISQEMPNHRVAHFTGDGQIAGSPRISREMPNRRSEHFTTCQSLHIFLHCFIFLVLGLKIYFVNHFFLLDPFLG